MMNETNAPALPGPKLFMSYRRADSAGIAGRIYDRLAAYFGRGALFKDVDNIPIGTNFEQVITSVIAQSSVALVLVGPTWATIANEQGRRLDDPRDVVRLEVEAALRRGIPVIPVLTEGAIAPDPATLPPSLQMLFVHGTLSVRNNPWFDGDMSQLATTLSQWLPLQVASAAATPAASATPGAPIGPVGQGIAPTSARPARRRQWFASPLGILAITVLLLALALIGITGAGLVGVGPLGRLGASSTPLATAPIQATATATPVEHVVFQAALTQPQTGWEIDSNCSFQSDGYHVTAPVGEAAFCLSPSSYANFHAQARVHAAAIAAPVKFVLFFRVTDTRNFDYFSVSLGGNQATWTAYSYRNGSGTYLGEDLATLPDASGASGTLLEVYANGPTFSIQVNGTRLGSFKDASNTVGQIGLGVLAGNKPATAIYTSVTIATLGS